jgi:hypothetical protein
MTKALRTAAILAMLLCIGCSPTPTEKPKRWLVKLIRPNGAVHRTWIVRSQNPPRVRTRWSGHTELVQDDSDAETDRLNLIAPVSWSFDLEELPESDLEHLP